jgi:hypothetical protein
MSLSKNSISQAICRVNQLLNVSHSCRLMLSLCVLIAVAGQVRGDGVSDRQAQFLNSFYQDYDNNGAVGFSAGPTFNWAYSAISLNKGQAKIDQANAAIQTYLTNNVDQWVNPQGDFATIDSYWQLPMVARLVSDPGLSASITPANQTLIKEFLWSFSESSEFPIANSMSANVVRDIYGSDNHDLHKRSVFWATAQLLKDDPNFQNRQYASGEVPQQRYTQWTNQLLDYFKHRASHGGSLEVGSPTYQGRYLHPVFTIGDIAQDSRLAEQARKYTDVIFADVALESINGMRGGAKSRAYKNRIAYPQQDRSAYYNYLFVGEPAAGLSLLSDGLHLLETFGATTSDYRIPEHILEYATDEAGRGTFDYVTNRMAQGYRDVYEGELNNHPSETSAMLRTSHVTPEHVLGWFTIDETKTYLQIHTQNQWMGAITDADPASRIGVFVTPTQDGKTGYQELQAVGSGEAMVARRQLAAGASTQMRVYISEDFTYAEENGWIFGTNGNDSTFFAVKGAIPTGSSTYSTLAAGDAPGGEYLTFDDQDANVILQTGRASDYADLAAFKQDILDNTVQWVSGATLEYNAGASNGLLTMFPDNRIPQVNGQTLDLTPTNVYASPYMNAPVGSSVVTLTDLLGNDHMIDFDYMPVVPTFGGEWVTVGDLDDFSDEGPASEDDPAVLPAWEQQFVTTLGHLDESGKNKTRLASIIAPIDQNRPLANARLVIRVRSAGSGSDNDALILDDPSNAIQLANLTVVETTLDAHVLSFDFEAADLAMLADGILNIAVSDDHELDWVMLNWGYEVVAGDVDGDGFVGIADLNIVLANWNQNNGSADPPYMAGDVDQNGFVGIADLNIVLGNWNAGTPPSAVTNIPEPASLALLGLGGLAMLRRRKA